MSTLPTDSTLRKEAPIFTGLMNYFPRAMAYGARISVLGNDKHNPGEPLHWAEGKSMDHPDCIARHLIEMGTFDPDDGALHEGKLFWRAAANLEIALKKREAAGLPLWDEEIIAKNKATLNTKLAAKLNGHTADCADPISDKPYAGDPPTLPKWSDPYGHTADCTCAICKPISDKPYASEPPIPPTLAATAEWSDPSEDPQFARLGRARLGRSTSEDMADPNAQFDDECIPVKLNHGA